MNILDPTVNCITHNKWHILSLHTINTLGECVKYVHYDLNHFKILVFGLLCIVMSIEKSLSKYESMFLQ